MIAFEYAQMHDLQKTLDALAESCRYAVIEANLKDMDYTAPNRHIVSITDPVMCCNAEIDRN